MSDWLVPVSKHVRFVDRNNRRIDATANTGHARVRDALLADRVASAAIEVRGSLVEARPGDTLWLYTAELDVGVQKQAAYQFGAAVPRSANHRRLEAFHAGYHCTSRCGCRLRRTA